MKLIFSDETDAVNPAQSGTKCAPVYQLNVQGGQEFVIKVRLYEKSQGPEPGSAFTGFDDIFAKRKQEADQFYNNVSL